MNPFENSDEDEFYDNEEEIAVILLQKSIRGYFDRKKTLEKLKNEKKEKLNSHQSENEKEGGVGEGYYSYDEFNNSYDSITATPAVQTM